MGHVQYYLISILDMLHLNWDNFKILIENIKGGGGLASRCGRFKNTDLDSPPPHPLGIFLTPSLSLEDTKELPIGKRNILGCVLSLY